MLHASFGSGWSGALVLVVAVHAREAARRGGTSVPAAGDGAHVPHVAVGATPRETALTLRPLFVRTARRSEVCRQEASTPAADWPRRETGRSPKSEAAVGCHRAEPVAAARLARRRRDRRVDALNRDVRRARRDVGPADVERSRTGSTTASAAQEGARVGATHAGKRLARCRRSGQGCTRRRAARRTASSEKRSRPNRAEAQRATSSR